MAVCFEVEGHAVGIQQMTEIKLEQADAQGVEEEEKPKVNIRMALRLAEKEQQDIMEHLQQFHNPQAHHAIDYEQEKTQLQKYLDLPPSSRSKKTIKSIKAELSYLSCLQIQAQSQMPKELLAIMKRDIDMLTAVISKFVYPKLYQKGTIIESVASNRQNVKILLKGEVAIFEPINYKAFKNCNRLRIAGSVDTEWLSAFLKRFSNEHYQIFSEICQPSNEHINPESLEEEMESYLMQNQALLPLEICRKILGRCGIITPNTPHRHTRTVHKTGQLICSEQQPFIVSQSKVVQHTAICLSETYVVQLQYNVYKAAISLLNSDEQKKYIQILLRKFAMLQYFDAKQYVKKEYMIDRKKEEKEEREKLEQEKKAKEEKNAEFVTQGTQKIVRENSPASSRSSKSKIQDEQLDIQTYQIKYDSDVYLVISGEATIIIDKIQETRASDIQHSLKVRNCKPFPILKLYASDLFGFEEIGKIKEYNLRYRVNKNSKLLLLNEAVYIKQYTEVPGFKQCFKSLQNQRNVLIANILKGLEKSLEEEQLRRYQSVSNLPVLNSPRPIKRVQFLGSSEFESVEGKLMQRMARDRQNKSGRVSFKQIMEGGQLRQGLKFASIYKQRLPKQCEVVGQYVQVRGKDGSLKRKKFITGDAGQQVFRKLGIISDEDRNNHNFALVSNRPSKYELGDFQRDKKEMKRLKSLAKGLPRLGEFFSKKSEMLYRNLHKRDY